MNTERIRWRDSLFRGVAWAYLSSLVVLGGVWFGVDCLVRQPHPARNEPGYWNAFGNRDGVAYARIAREGYTYDPKHQSSVVFCPAYPLVGRAITAVFGIPEEVSLMVTSSVCLIAAMILFGRYLAFPDGGRSTDPREYALAAMGLWPTTLFFRMAHTESMFLLILLLTMNAMQRDRSPWLVAVLIGLATAVRFAGCALLVPLVVWLWRRSPNVRSFVGKSLVLTPVACWGVLAYAAFLGIAFGEPLAFATNQGVWWPRDVVPAWRQVLDVATLKPIWSCYLENSPSYWGQFGALPENPLLNLYFWNPIYFVLTAGLLVVGWRKRWLNSREIALGAALLLIPYVAVGHMAMRSQARYASVVFPAYIVMGHIAARLPPAVTAALFAISGFLLGTYSALFAAWYHIF